jgi:hypothetical protein
MKKKNETWSEINFERKIGISLCSIFSTRQTAGSFISCFVGSFDRGKRVGNFRSIPGLKLQVFKVKNLRENRTHAPIFHS